MKKLAAAALTLTMALAMSTPVHATIITDVTRLNDSTQIYATYEEGVTTTDTVYNVDVEWGNLEYTYHPNAEKVWSPYDLKYVIYERTPFWTCEDGADQIKVTNHSNAAISAKLEYEQTNAEVTGTFDKSKINLKSAEKTAVDEAPTGTATLALGGKMAEDADSTLGSVKVTIGDFEGDKADSSVIYSPYLSFYTTKDDGVFVATGTVTYTDSFDISSFIPLSYLKINGSSYCVLDPNNSVVRLQDNTLTEFTFKESASNVSYNNKFRPRTDNKEYSYTLTINLKTKTGTIIASPVE